MDTGLGRVLQVGHTATEIALDTRARNPIRNQQAIGPPHAGKLLAWEHTVKKHGAWTERKPRSSLYNCAGLVWAARRTAIWDEPAFQLILRDDGYRRIDMRDVRAGDLVLYIGERFGERDTHHVALVLRVEAATDELGIPSITSLSKFQDFTEEFEHLATDVDFGQGIDYQIEYWTDRP